MFWLRRKMVPTGFALIMENLIKYISFRTTDHHFTFLNVNLYLGDRCCLFIYLHMHHLGDSDLLIAEL